MNPLMINTLILERELEDRRLELLMRCRERDAMAPEQPDPCRENRVSSFARMLRMLKPQRIQPQHSCECS